MTTDPTDLSVSGRPTITVVTPVFNEADNLPRFEAAVTAVLMADAAFDFRVVFVEDGSRDRSWEVIRDICRRDARFRGIRLSRNFGSHIALSAGLGQAAGDAVTILACDLQDPPEVVLEFARAWRAGADIVWGKRRTRADPGWRVAASKSFEWLTRRYAMPDGSRFTTGSFLLMDRKVLDCYLQFPETNRITFALVAWTGFDQAVVEYDRQARTAGKSSWRLSALFKASYDTMLGFSVAPIRFMALLGLLVFLVASLLSVYVVVCFLTGTILPGWTSLMLTVSVFSGLQLLVMSVQGEYLSRIYAESRRRPLFFVSDRTECAGPGPGPLTPGPVRLVGRRRPAHPIHPGSP